MSSTALAPMHMQLLQACHIIVDRRHPGYHGSCLGRLIIRQHWRISMELCFLMLCSGTTSNMHTGCRSVYFWNSACINIRLSDNCAMHADAQGKARLERFTRTSKSPDHLRDTLLSPSLAVKFFSQRSLVDMHIPFQPFYTSGDFWKAFWIIFECLLSLVACRQTVLCESKIWWIFDESQEPLPETE